MPNLESQAIAFFDRNRRADAPMSRRQAIWLVTMMAREPGDIIAVDSTMDADESEMRLRIFDVLDQDPKIHQRLRQEIVRQLLPDDELQWITTDPELLKWLRKAFQNRPGRRGHMGALTPLRLDSKDELILDLDLWGSDRQTKRTFVETLRGEWGANTQQHRLLRWFDDAEYEKCVSARFHTPSFRC